MVGLPVATAAAMVVQGSVAVQADPTVPARETKAPFTVSAAGMHVLLLHSRNPVLHANPH